MNLERSDPAPGPDRPDGAPARDRWLDLLRAGSLSVVVLWH
ncbi:MAG TPA: hypothetical protein VM143_17315 [Acidimicrobiales bacterium]|nr:hypothetical protein [Acidimicrobiales bacterium]